MLTLTTTITVTSDPNSQTYCQTHSASAQCGMCKIVRNCAILLQNTTLNLTITHAVAMTLTLTHDPNFNPIAIPHIPHSAIPHFTVPPNPHFTVGHENAFAARVVPRTPHGVTTLPDFSGKFEEVSDGEWKEREREGRNGRDGRVEIKHPRKQKFGQF